MDFEIDGNNSVLINAIELPMNTTEIETIVAIFMLKKNRLTPPLNKITANIRSIYNNLSKLIPGRIMILSALSGQL